MYLQKEIIFIRCGCTSLVDVTAGVLLGTCRILAKLEVRLVRSHPKFQPQCIHTVGISHCALYIGIAFLRNSFLQCVPDPPDDSSMESPTPGPSIQLTFKDPYYIHPISPLLDLLRRP